MQPQRDLGDHAERAFRSDEQARQVVAGRRLARARAGPDDRCRRRGRPSARARSRASCRSGPPSCPTRASRPCRRSSRRRRDRPERSRPVLLSALFSCSRVTPASTVASRSSTLTRTTWFISRRSMVMPPWIALTCPSSDVPAPNGTIGRRWAARDPHDRGDLVGRVREADDVGRRGRVVRLAVAVMLADDRGVVRARAEQAEARERGQHDVCGWSGHAGQSNPALVGFADRHPVRRPARRLADGQHHA